jgi:hypothetical protein
MKIDYIRAFSNSSSIPAVALQTVSSPDGGGYSLYSASPTASSFPCSHTDFADAFIPQVHVEFCLIQAMRRRIKAGPFPGRGSSKSEVINSGGCASGRAAGGAQRSDTPRRERRWYQTPRRGIYAAVTGDYTLDWASGARQNGAWNEAYGPSRGNRHLLEPDIFIR